MNDYFTYDTEVFIKKAGIPITVLDSAEEVFQMMAQDMVDTIEQNNRKQEKTVFIVPVGPVGQYPFFVSLVNRKRVDLHHVWFINMDEYLDEHGAWLSLNHRLSFRNFMNQKVYKTIDPTLVMPDEQRIFPNPRDPISVDHILDRMGKIDVCYGGIGITGHLAFNEPEAVSVETFANRPTRVLSISKETRAVNSVGDLHGAISVMPTQCITIGMAQILKAKRIVLGCFRDWHRAVIRQAACGEVSALFPATLLQKHPDARIIVPASVAEKPYDSLLLE